MKFKMRIIKSSFLVEVNTTAPWVPLSVIYSDSYFMNGKKIEKKEQLGHRIRPKCLINNQDWRFLVILCIILYIMYYIIYYDI